MKSEVIHTQKEKSWMVSFIHGITSFKKSNARETALAAPEEDQSQHSCLRGSQPPITRDAALLRL